MNLFTKLAIFCLLLTSVEPIFSQCITGQKIEAFGGDTVIFTCPDGRSDVVSFKSFTYATPFIFVITDKNNIIRQITKYNQIDFDTFIADEYHVYGVSYKGVIKDVIGKSIKTSPITDLCYGLSTNYITVIRDFPKPPVVQVNPDPRYVCGPDQRPDVITITTTFNSKSKSKYLIANEKNIIVTIQDQNNIDLDPLNCKTCKAYAVSYTGDFTGKIGSSIQDALSNDCFALSSTYMTIFKDLPKGGRIALDNGSNNLFICSTSKKDQFISTSLTDNSLGYVKYIVTDTLDKVLAIADKGILPASGLLNGICRLRALTFTGKLTTDYLTRNYKSIVWSDDCYALTDNFVTIKKELPDGGTVEKSESINVICKDGNSDTIQLSSLNSKGAKFAWIGINSAHTIAVITTNNFIDADALALGNYQFIHVGYTGNLKLKIGDTLLRSNSVFLTSASDDCYDYSDNYLEVAVAIPQPGNLSFSNGDKFRFLCSNDSSGLKINLNYSANNLFNTSFILTNAGDKIIDKFSNANIDFKVYADGDYKMYPLSYSGNLTIVNGSPISQSGLSTGCFKLGEAVTIKKGTIKGGEIHLSDNSDSLLLCENSSISKIKLISKNYLGNKFQYILTSQHDTILKLIDSDSLDIKSIQNGLCKVFGISYSGDLNLTAGDYIRKSNASNACFELSTNYITLIKDKPIGGRISLFNGDTTYQICTKDGWPDKLTFKKSSGSFLPYGYIATDRNNQIVSLDASINLETLGGLISKIYGVSYLGKITANIGDDITQVGFSTACYSLSENYIQISQDEISGGSIRTNNASNLINLCASSITVDTVILKSNGVGPSVKYKYLFIQNDTLQYISSSGILTSQEVPLGTSTVYGIAYKGSFLGKIGDKISEKRLVDSCYGISTNSVEFRKYKPNAGTVNTGTGQNSFFLCPGDGVPDYINLQPEGAAPLSYAYIVTNQKDSILEISESQSFDLDGFSLGICKIYGLSYQGVINFKSKSIHDMALVQGCFDISSNSIKVIKSTADGARISLASGDTLINICVEDLAPDTLRLYNSSTVSLKYAYLITDEHNRLQSLIENPEKTYDFNGADPGSSRIYGVSYGGVLSVFRNDDITKIRLATGCYDLSDNYVTINKSNTGNQCKNIGTNEKNSAFIAMFPNPAVNDVTIQLKSKYLKSGKPELNLLSGFGATLQKIILDNQMIDSQQIRLNTSNLNPGIYFLVFKNGYIFDRLKLVISK